LTWAREACSCVGMVNVLNEEKKQQVLALGRLGWSLRRIEQATAVRRETASAYLKAAGIVVRGRGGRPSTWPPEPATTTEASTDSGSSKPATTGEVSTDLAYTIDSAAVCRHIESRWRGGVHLREYIAGQAPSRRRLSGLWPETASRRHVLLHAECHAGAVGPDRWNMSVGTTGADRPCSVGAETPTGRRPLSKRSSSAFATSQIGSCLMPVSTGRRR
jgi:hypothetical protein